MKTPALKRKIPEVTRYTVAGGVERQARVSEVRVEEAFVLDVRPAGRYLDPHPKELMLRNHV